MGGMNTKSFPSRGWMHRAVRITQAADSPGLGAAGSDIGAGSSKGRGWGFTSSRSATSGSPSICRWDARSSSRAVSFSLSAGVVRGSANGSFFPMGSSSVTWGYSFGATHGSKSNGRRSPMGESPGIRNRLLLLKCQGPLFHDPFCNGSTYPVTSPTPFSNTRAMRARSSAFFSRESSGVTLTGSRCSFQSQ